MEIWKDIPGYEGKYQVNNIGSIKSLLTNKIMKYSLEKTGYLRVSLSNGIRGNHTKYLVHNLVLKSFQKQKENTNQINHIDGNKHNNKLENLEWCDGKHNIREAIRLGLKKPTKYWLGKFGKDNKQSKKVGQYKDGELINIFYGISEAGRYLKYDISDISKVCLGKKQHIKGFIFKYI